MTDPYRIKRIVTKLGDVWALYPNLTLGQLFEQIEDDAWDFYYVRYPTRFFSARLANLDDAAFEGALNKWISDKARPHKTHNPQTGEPVSLS